MRKLLFCRLDKPFEHFQLIFGIFGIRFAKHTVNDELACPVIVLGVEGNNHTDPVEKSHTYVPVGRIIGTDQHKLRRMNLAESLTFDKYRTSRHGVHDMRYRRTVQQTQRIHIKHPFVSFGKHTVLNNTLTFGKCRLEIDTAYQSVLRNVQRKFDERRVFRKNVCKSSGKR